MTTPAKVTEVIRPGNTDDDTVPAPAPQPVEGTPEWDKVHLNIGQYS